MQLTEKAMEKLAGMIATAVIKALDERGIKVTGESEAGNRGKTKSAYAKTESLLYSYCGFKRIVADREREIEEIRIHGVPERSGSIVQYSPHSGTVGGTVLPEESVEQAIQRIRESVVDTVRAIALIDKCMGELKSDPYYKILEMRYFEGRTQDEIAVHFGVSQVTISNNKSRLVKELSMRLFPNQVVDEMLK